MSVLMNLIVDFVSALKSAVVRTAERNVPNLNIVAANIRILKERQIFLSTGMFITIGVTGKIRGQILYRLDNISALKLSSLMLNTNFTVIDEMAQSALSELTNIISGATLSSEAFGKLDIDIFPPTVFQGSKISLNALKMDVIQIPFSFNGGILDIFLAIEDYDL